MSERGSQLDESTVRQIQLDMIRGISAQYTASRLDIGLSTVKRYRKRIKESGRLEKSAVQRLL